MEQKLRNLLQEVEYTCLQGKEDKTVQGLIYDSRQDCLGCVFFCIQGFRQDGHTFAAEAVKKGASVLVVEREIRRQEALAEPGSRDSQTESEGTATVQELPKDITLLLVKDARKALAQMSAAWFSHPARELFTIGITGTKGKTTMAYMIYRILAEAGLTTGLIGTIETIVGDRAVPAQNTTPESYLIQKAFREMADSGCTCVVMEVSSQGLMLNRVEGFQFDYGIFTNLEPDHIGPGEHKDFAEYRNCKSLLFRRCRHGILNGDDPHTKEILAGHTCTVETFGIRKKADWMAEQILCKKENNSLQVAFTVSGEGVEKLPVTIGIPGEFNVYNALAAMTACRRVGKEAGLLDTTIQKAALRALSKIRIKGRMEPVPVSEEFALFIDYAHNAMSLKGMLETIRAYRPRRLICLFGCGGNRSGIRRYEMGEVSAKLADLTVVTTDNPRFEDPEAILEDIITGIKRAGGDYVRIADRKEAIRYCLKTAGPGDVVVLAGKGHEDYQEICGKKYPMDERQLIRDILREEEGGKTFTDLQ